MNRREVGGGWKTAGDLDWRLLGLLGQRQFGTNGQTVSGVRGSMKITRIINVPLEPRAYHKYRVKVTGRVKVKTIDRDSYSDNGHGHLGKSGTQHNVEGWLYLVDIIWAMRQARKYSGNSTEYYVAYNSYGFAVGYCVYEDDAIGCHDDKEMVGAMKADESYRNFNDDFPTNSMRLCDIEDIRIRHNA